MADKAVIIDFLKSKSAAKSKFYFKDFTDLFPGKGPREVKKLLTQLVNEEVWNSGPPVPPPCTASRARASSPTPKARTSRSPSPPGYFFATHCVSIRFHAVLTSTKPADRAFPPVFCQSKLMLDAGEGDLCKGPPPPETLAGVPHRPDDAAAPAALACPPAARRKSKARLAVTVRCHVTTPAAQSISTHRPPYATSLFFGEWGHLVPLSLTVKAR